MNEEMIKKMVDKKTLNEIFDKKARIWMRAKRDYEFEKE